MVINYTLVCELLQWKVSNIGSKVLYLQIHPLICHQLRNTEYGAVWNAVEINLIQNTDTCIFRSVMKSGDWVAKSKCEFRHTNIPTKFPMLFVGYWLISSTGVEKDCILRSMPEKRIFIYAKSNFDCVLELDLDNINLFRLPPTRQSLKKVKSFWLHIIITDLLSINFRWWTCWNRARTERKERSLWARWRNNIRTVF